MLLQRTEPSQIQNPPTMLNSRLCFPSSSVSLKLEKPTSGTRLLHVVREYLKKPPPVYTVFTKWKRMEDFFSQLSMLMTLLPSPNSITFTDASIHSQTVSCVQLML